MTSPNTESDKSIDELLGEILGQELARWRGTTPLEDFVNADDLYRTLRPRLEELLATQRQTYYSLLMDVIGFDDDVNSFINQESDEDLLITLQENARNKLRAEQRTKLNKLFYKGKI